MIKKNFIIIYQKSKLNKISRTNWINRINRTKGTNMNKNYKTIWIMNNNNITYKRNKN